MAPSDYSVQVNGRVSEWESDLVSELRVRMNELISYWVCECRTECVSEIEGRVNELTSEKLIGWLNGTDSLTDWLIFNTQG